MKLEIMFKALGDRTRLEILQLLSKKEMCVCEIMEEFTYTQPAISHHLKVLKEADLVVDIRRGKWIFYSAQIEKMSALKAFFCEQENSCKKRILKDTPEIDCCGEE